jgi:hypothetical protein
MNAHRRVLLVVLAVLLVTACNNQPADLSTTPVQPQVSFAANGGNGGNSGFMPMAPGNHWNYEGAFTTTIIPEGAAPDPPIVEPWTIQREQVDYQSLAGQDYMLEREVFIDAYGYSVVERHWRQDPSGYYLFDLEVSVQKGADRPVLTRARDRTANLAVRYGADPASMEAFFGRVEKLRRSLRGFAIAVTRSPPGGVAFGEITTLAYPLHAGATWVIREDPRFAATVEAHEQYHGYPAWRVRLDNEYLGENDFAYTWYSRCGEVGTYLHVENLYVGEDGTVLGAMILEDAGTLVDARIQRGGCDTD